MQPEAHAAAFEGAFPALNRYVYTIYSIDESGRQFILADGERGSGDRSDRRYFQEAMSGTPVSRQVLMGRSLSPPAPAVAYGLPINSLENEEPTGVLLLAATLAELSAIVSRTVMDGAQAFVVDENGRLIAHTESSELSTEELVDYSATAPVAAATTGESEEFFYYESDGDTIISNYRKMENGWTVFSAIPEAVVTAGAARFSRIEIIIAAIGLVSVTILISVVVGATLRPLADLGGKLESFASGGGDLTERLQIRRSRRAGVGG